MRSTRQSARALSVASALLVVSPMVSADSTQSDRTKWLISAHSGGDFYLSQARTQAGLGGGVGIRLHWGTYWVAEGSFGILAGTGTVQVVRLAVGLERSGWYCPGVLVGARLFAGDSLRFLTEQHPNLIDGPVATVGLTLVPARFRAGQAELAVGSVYAGIGSDFPGFGWSMGVTIAEIASGI